MVFTILLALICIHIVELHGTKVNVDVTLPRKDIYPLFSEEEIWGMEYNKTDDTVKLNVVIDAAKSVEIMKLKDTITNFDMISSDVEQVIRRTMSRINNTAKWTPSARPETFFDEYRTWEEYEEFIRALLLRHPIITSRSILGQTFEGRDIPIITISAGNANKPGFYIMAAVHAREWLANMATMYILNALVDGYGNDDEITEVLNNVNIYIAPTVNIDGYLYTWTTDRMWRKNRRNNGGGSYGVDINRNWGPIETWCTSGSSTNPNSDTFCGTSMFSEPETFTASQFIMDPNNNISAAIDMHTSGPLILWPWQYTYDELPPIFYDQFVELGGLMEESIQNVHGMTYRSIQGSDLYPHSGGMIDFVWSQGSMYGFTFEGRGPGFAPPASNILPAGEEQLAAILSLAKTLY